MDDKIKQAEEYVKENIIDEFTWQHTNAMRPIAVKIADIEGGDKDIIDLAVLFHDVERGNCKPEEHAEKGAETTKKVMTEIGFKEEIIKKVVHCVASHSTPWTNTGPIAETIEAKVLYDADVVQNISPFGIVKQFHEVKDKDFNEQVSIAKEMITEKVPTGAFTETSKNMINQRMPYIKDFFKKVLEE